MRSPKSEWGPGPWQDEPDRQEFTHAGLTCLARRGPVGAWCGYVAVPFGHPAYGQSYRDVDAEVHGGLTYADDAPPDATHGNGAWWLGFDCNHSFDFSPMMAAYRLQKESNYRTLDYVIAETKQLADQLAAMHAVAADGYRVFDIN